jgi:hypothetical protein
MKRSGGRSRLAAAGGWLMCRAGWLTAISIRRCEPLAEVRIIRRCKTRPFRCKSVHIAVAPGA